MSDETTTTATEGEDEVAATKTKKAKAPKKERAVKAASNGHTRGAKTQEIARLLQRKNGCTAKEILEMTGWPSVSVPAMSKACGLKLRKEKEKGSPTRYYGE